MDQDRANAFLFKVIGDMSASAVLSAAYLADKTGLLAAMRGAGALTPEAAAERAGLDPRSTQEVLSALAAGGYLDYNPVDETFELPVEHEAVLADPDDVRFLGGIFEMLAAGASAAPKVADGMHDGSGVAFAEYGEAIVDAIARANAPTIRNMLGSFWIPASAAADAALRGGGRLLDAGCGSGHAALAVARSYPEATVLGIDVDPTSLGRAAALVDEAGIGDRVEFREMGITDLDDPGGFDVVLTLDVIHDVAEPEAVLQAIHAAVKPDGVYLMAEPNMSSDLAQNLHQIGAFYYAVSALHCVPQSLAAGGPGLGAGWGVDTAERYGRDAGFRGARVLEIGNPFTALIELRP